MKTGIAFLWLLSFVCLNCPTVSFGQVEHNYPMASGYTNCDSLDLTSLNKEQALDLLSHTRFRFKQEFKLTRKQGLKRAVFYSCHGETGFLAVKFHDHAYLFKNVTKNIWTGFSGSNDPEGYFTKQILNKYIQIE